MGMTAAEQYMLELVNRARLDPRGEVQRLTDEVGAIKSGTLSEGNGGSSTLPDHALDPLASNFKLNRATDMHVDWMLQMDRFSHTGKDGSSAGVRMEVEGYDSTRWAENIAFSSQSQNVDTQNNIEVLHRNLFESDGHRANLLDSDMREVGIGVDAGDFYGRDTTLAAQSFGRAGNDWFLTGVAYDDRDGDNFYSLGEGKSGVGFSMGKSRTDSEDAGGYNLSMGSDGSAPRVTIVSGNTEMRVKIEDISGNVKLDVINGDTLSSSASLNLGSGAENATLLGIEKLSLSGNRAQNTLIGNDAGNRLKGYRGDDKLFGEGGKDILYGAKGQDLLNGGRGQNKLFGGVNDDELFGQSGHDRLYGGSGGDVMYGGWGRDYLNGGNGDDHLYGGKGSDRLYGNAGDDLMVGGNGSDEFVFRSGHGENTIRDFDALDNREDIVLRGVTAITSYSDLAANHMVQSGANVVIDDGDGLVITLINVDLSDLGAGDFLF